MSGCRTAGYGLTDVNTQRRDTPNSRASERAVRIGLRLIGQTAPARHGPAPAPSRTRSPGRPRRAANAAGQPDVHLGVGSFDVEIPEFDGGGWEAASGSRAATITTHP